MTVPSHSLTAKLVAANPQGRNTTVAKTSKASKPAAKHKPAPAPKKAAAKPAPKAKAPAAKPAPKPAPKVVAKVDPKKVPAKPVAAPAKSGAKSAPAKAPVAPAKGPPPKGVSTKSGAPVKVETPAPAPAGGGEAKKPGGKGITVVTPRPSRPTKPKVTFKLPQTEPLLKPGGKWKPLIASGPSAPAIGHLSRPAGDTIKTHLNKKELERYRLVLIRKRAQLAGDIVTIEDEALRQSSGSLSHMPQHMAEQGTEMFDQALSLDLAQADRNLIREIDAALKRIEDGTYGVCELTGKPIKAERLEELPWTRYSIEAARELERRPYLA